MVEVLPFRGIRYNPENINDMDKVITPPFDVINPQAQSDFYDRHSNNMIRLVLGKRFRTDSETNNQHTRAAGYLNRWLTEHVLMRDNTPAFYLTSVEFTVEGKSLTRYGVIARVRLEPFEKKIILPHEKTFSKVKSERLDLTKACRTNFSPIFSLFPGRVDILENLQAEVCNQTAESDLIDPEGYRHKMWRLTDTQTHTDVCNALKEKKLFIADGHHRYETALNYKKWLSDHSGGLDKEHPANYVMMYLCSMDDPGLVILPAHRMFKGLTNDQLGAFLPCARNHFDIDIIPFQDDTRQSALSELSKALLASHHENTIGVFIKNTSEYYLLKPKPGTMAERFGGELPEALIDLDVTVLTNLILMKILGFDQDRLDNEKLVGYASRAELAIDHVAAGNYDITFILNPTRIEQVRRVSEAGLIMPRKATYFFPKVLSGLVINPLSEG
ncbi:DUF1015 domain-containing protein [Thermodesulfobacteriota bacterium]